MLLAKRLADALTAGRALLALVLAGLSWPRGEELLPVAALVLLACWCTDLFDGALARRSGISEQTWIGSHDLEADALVSLGVLAYLVGSGYLALVYAMVYLLLWAVIFQRWGWRREPAMLFQAPIYLWFLTVALRDAPTVGIWLVAWIVAVVVVTWPRFPDEVVPGFVDGMRRALRQD
ncbi:MAG TPA: CDP-alcohol phosphatidyltransferase family protein [Anaerolineales bacterium]|nr:CDP-alcohol phosphatidyltransferase family protein [Anaerolineales bacterium]